jgi:hypothetical protein
MRERRGKREIERGRKKKISFKEREKKKSRKFVLVLDFFLFDNRKKSSSLDDYSEHIYRLFDVLLNKKNFYSIDD